MTKTALLTLSAWLLTSAVPSEDLTRVPLDNWHQWRGPEANGTAPHGDPPVTWDEHTHVRWKAPLSGKGSA